MSPKSKSLYSVQGYQGAHLLLGVRTTEQGDIADVQLIGAPLPFSVPVSQCQAFTPAEALREGDPITLLAQEAVTVYSLVQAESSARQSWRVIHSPSKTPGVTSSINPFSHHSKSCVSKAQKAGMWSVRISASASITQKATPASIASQVGCTARQSSVPWRRPASAIGQKLFPSWSGEGEAMNHNEEIIIQGIAERLREAYRMSQLLHDHTRDQLAAYFERQQVSPIWEIKYMAITLENALQEIVSS